MRLPADDIHPFDPQASHPSRSPLQASGKVIEEPPHSKTQITAQAWSVRVNPPLLKGISKGDQDNSGFRSIDLLDDRLVLRRGEIAMMRSGDPQAGDQVSQALRRLFRHSLMTAEQEYSDLPPRRQLTELGSQVRADEIRGERLSRESAGQLNSAPVIEQHIGIIQDVSKGSVGPCQVQGVGVHNEDFPCLSPAESSRQVSVDRRSVKSIESNAQQNDFLPRTVWTVGTALSRCLAPHG